MAEFEPSRKTSSVPAAAYAVDAGLRAFMLGVYRYMAGGLGLSGLMAFFTYRAATVSEAGQIVGLTPLGAAIYQSPLSWVIMLAPSGLHLRDESGGESLPVFHPADLVLAVCGGYGAFSFLHIPTIYGSFHHPGVLRDRRRIRRLEPIRIHHQ